jgi:hypothetical protein
LRRQIIAALLCAPLAVNAQTLRVEYQGTVSSVERMELAEAPPYAVGDAISGTLIIDATLAPPDSSAGDPHFGRYSSGSAGTDFVLGPTRVEGRGTGDLVQVHDDWSSPTDAPYDGFFVRDQSIGTEGAFNIVLGMQRPTLLGQLFSDDGLVQSFDVESDAGTTLWGFIERGFGEFWRLVSFTLDRFSVTPGVCHS